MKYIVRGEKVNITIDMIKDYSEMSSMPDLVICNHCDKIMLVDNAEDTCPNCHKSGTLMDIKQDINL